MKKIFDFGVSDTNETYVNQSIRISNKVALIIILVGLSYIVLTLFYTPQLVVVPLIMTFGSTLSLILNRYYVTDISRVLLAFIIAAMVALYHAFPVRAGAPMMMHFYVGQFVITLLPWVFIDLRERYLLFISVFINYAIFFSQPWLNENFHMNIDGAWLRSDFLVYATYFSSIVVAVLSMGLFHSRFKDNANKANEVSNEIANKVSEMQNRQRELQKRIDEINETYKEEENRSWIASGLSQMTNLMRQTKSDVIFPELIEAITKYMDVAQGAIYLVEEDEHTGNQIIKLEGCYAFDRRKFISKQIPYGDGLLGQCCLEREIIKVNNVPDSYVEITTGLGDEPPRNLVIVPLIYDEKVMGALEMLAYNSYSEHEIDFLRQLGENIGSFVSTNLINIKTKELLEQSQQQAEEMRAQEEEMRQNMEELQATQEEMARKENEYLKKIQELEASVNEKEQNTQVDG